MSEKKKFLSKQTRPEIDSRDDRVYQDVYIPVWDIWVCVRSLTAMERDKFEKDIVTYDGKKIITRDNIRAKLFVLSIVDPETHELLYTLGDVENVGKKNAAAIDTVFSVASKLSKISDEDVEELIKNSGTARGDSPS